MAPLLTCVLLNKPSSASPHPETGGERISPCYLASLGHEDCKWAFRFTSQELQQIADVLELPNPLITKCGYHASVLESFALLCAHLHSPNTQWALVCKYNRPQSAVSEIVNETASFINNHWGHLLDWDGLGLLHPQHLHEYAGALHDFGAPCQTIFGFIDCTIRPSRRVSRTCVVIPNGLIGHLSGPFRVPQNDMGVLVDSRLLEYLELHAIQPGSRQGDLLARHYFQVYGDSAYGVSPVMHGFGMVLQDWPQLNCFWRQWIWGTQCGVMYRVGVLLTNTRACLVPNQTSCC
ncbi:hypothetical protein K439DRAFT_1654528 [Ramaria rubella]|nr:hypothetical protein K439DRAFT_1654528 [Ramaria rubella]